jgi:hypothetical protein
MKLQVFSASVPESKRESYEPSIVLVRIYGNQTDLIIDRQRELVVCTCFHLRLIDLLRTLLNVILLDLDQRCMVHSRTGIFTSSLKESQ